MFLYIPGVEACAESNVLKVPVEMTVYYNAFGNGRQTPGIQSTHSTQSNRYTLPSILVYCTLETTAEKRRQEYKTTSLVLIMQIAWHFHGICA